MSFLDRFKEQANVVRGAAGGVAQNAVKQSKSLAAMARIKVAISTEEGKAKEAYTELGRLYYRDYEAGTEIVPEDYQPWLDQVADAKAQIDRLNAELAEARAQGEAPVEEAEIPAEEDAATLEVVETAEEPAEDVLEQEIVIEVVDEPAPDIPEVSPLDTLYVDVTGAEE